MRYRDGSFEYSFVRKFGKNRFQPVIRYVTNTSIDTCIDVLKQIQGLYRRIRSKVSLLFFEYRFLQRNLNEFSRPRNIFGFDDYVIAMKECSPLLKKKFQ